MAGKRTLQCWRSECKSSFGNACTLNNHGNSEFKRYFRNLVTQPTVLIQPVCLANNMDSFDCVLYDIRGVPLT